jgi:hypothetical protein
MRFISVSSLCELPIGKRCIYRATRTARLGGATSASAAGRAPPRAVLTTRPGVDNGIAAMLKDFGPDMHMQ